MDEETPQGETFAQAAMRKLHELERQVEELTRTVADRDRTIGKLQLRLAHERRKGDGTYDRMEHQTDQEAEQEWREQKPRVRHLVHDEEEELPEPEYQRFHKLQQEQRSVTAQERVTDAWQEQFEQWRKDHPDERPRGGSYWAGLPGLEG